MGIVLYTSYNVDIVITLLIIGVELISLYMYPSYMTKLIYIQLEYSAIKATINKQIAYILRIICSFVPSLFCTTIGLAVGVIYQLMSTHYIISKNKLSMEIKKYDIKLLILS